MNDLTVDCAISGGGPAGVMLGYLLARSGVSVAVLEKWPDFFRDFRGDTIHPSTMQVLRELGLFEKFRTLPHDETKQIGVRIGKDAGILADFTHLKHVPPFLGFIPQWDFLNFIAEEGRPYPGFHLLMETEATDLIRDGGAVAGLRANGKNGEFSIRAKLVVGADGRHSSVRDKTNLPLEELGAPIDVLWFRLPRKDDGTDMRLGFADQGRMMVLIDRDTYWQCGYLIKKGGAEEVKARGLEAFKESIVALVPMLKDAVHDLKGFDDVKTLSVAVDRLTKWYEPGLLIIGDAAHAMSPIGGVGINLAIQDAVASANVLVPAFMRGGPTARDLAQIQKRRFWPAAMIQKAQVFLHTHALEYVLTTHEPLTMPWQMKLFTTFPYLRRIPAYVIGVGLRPEHVHTAETPAH